MASGRVGVTRLRFLREGLAELDATLRGRLGLPLLVPRGPPVETLRRCWRRFGAAALTWEACGEEYAVARDGAVREAAAQDGVRVAAVPGHTLHDPEALLALCPCRELPTKYNDFLRLLEAAGPPPAPRPEVEPLPPRLLAAARALLPAGSEAAAMAVPASLAAMGCKEEVDEAEGKEAAGPGEACQGFRLRGGEVAALERLQEVVVARPAWVRRFDKPSSNPLQWAPGSTSMLSPYLKFGMLSCRTLHAALDAAVAGCDDATTPPQSLHGQLYWREFFYALQHATPNFCRAASNPLCLQVAWREPKRDAAAAADLQRWAEGRTGVPLVDAAMAQLRATGWLHHLLRHVVACFLTRGQLWVHWEAGVRRRLAPFHATAPPHHHHRRLSPPSPLPTGPLAA